MRRMLRTILCTALSAALLLGGGTQANAALTDVYYEKEGQVDYGDVYWPILVDGFYCVLNPLTGRATIEGAKCSGTVLKFQKLTLPATVKYIGKGTFEGIKKSCKIYVPDKNVKRLVLRSGFKGKVVVK